MKRLLFFTSLFFVGLRLYAQIQQSDLIIVKKAACTPVKDQASTGTCWSFSTTSLVESQAFKDGAGEIDLSEMFTVRNIYSEKAKNYIFRQGHAQFGPGGLGHDVIRTISENGAMPERAYPGLLVGKISHDHSELDGELKDYLDSLLKLRPVPNHWMDGFESILDKRLGKVPGKFMYKEKQYTAATFAAEILRFKGDDYVNITSFTHHAFYEPFILEVPDNFSNGAYYNLPLDELVKLTEHAIENGYSVMWDADCTNKFFKQRIGFAMQWTSDQGAAANAIVNPDEAELKYDPIIRQTLFENLTTQDDHLMHLVGLEKSKSGKKFFLVKNSWGEVGPYKGYIHVSEAYFAINTISLVFPKAALDNALKLKLGLK